MARSRTRSASRTPPAKRVKLETPPPSTLTGPYIKSDFEEEDLEDEDADRCSICLQPIADRTVVPLCAHEFCFDCLIVWTAQSRRCPLCSQAIGAFLIHRIRSRFDYQKHFLSPLPTSPRALPPPQLPLRQRAPRRRRSREWGRGRAENAESDKLDRSIARRRWVYEHDLYAKHVASNAYTRYRPYPNPAQFAASPELVSRTTIFLRRELQVWVNLDVEFLTTFILSIMKALDIRSEGAVKLLAEFLDLDAPGPYEEGGRHRNAEHFAHEVYTYVRSPYRDLFVYDSVVQVRLRLFRLRLSFFFACCRFFLDLESYSQTPLYPPSIRTTTCTSTTTFTHSSNSTPSLTLTLNPFLPLTSPLTCIRSSLHFYPLPLLRYPFLSFPFFSPPHLFCSVEIHAFSLRFLSRFPRVY
ncbi:hypothetical protein B0H11DRAFT_1743340 [Mycena galericulata]|nr:hypothetical protein B0H11DRAFT_1743340 [Mycena galericulata]